MLKFKSSNAIFWVDKSLSKMPKTVLPDRSLFIGQTLVENAKIKESKCDIWSHFQTMCVCRQSDQDYAECQLKLFQVLNMPFQVLWWYISDKSIF